MALDYNDDGIFLRCWGNTKVGFGAEDGTVHWSKEMPHLVDPGDVATETLKHVLWHEVSSGFEKIEEARAREALSASAQTPVEADHEDAGQGWG